MSFDWKSLVKTVAPVLGGTLGGPLGAMATKVIAGALLGDENASEEAIEQALATGNPDILLKLKQADQDFKLKMREAGIKEEDLHRLDRGSARELAAKTSIKPQIILSIFYDVAYVLVIYFAFTVDWATITTTQNNVIMLVIGILSAALIQVNNFWFGSSSGSKEKTAIMGGPK